MVTHTVLSKSHLNEKRLEVKEGPEGKSLSTKGKKTAVLRKLTKLKLGGCTGIGL